MKTDLGRVLLLVVAGVSLCCACSSKKSSPSIHTSCSTANPCKTPLTCVAGYCLQSCTDSTQCQEPLTCIGGFCEQFCADSTQCADGMICTSQGFCVTPECSNTKPCQTPLTCVDGSCKQSCSDSTPCSDGLTCSSQGYCGTPEWEQYPTCDNETFTGTKVTPNVMLVLDTSGSMADSINCPNPPSNCPDSTSKIAALQTAVNNILTLNATETVIRFGLTTFPGNGKCTTGTIRVPLQVTDDYATTVTIDASITTAVGSITPANSTPTGPTLQYLNDSTNCPQLFDSTRDNYIILATDGMPNCPNSSGNGPGQAMLDAINALPDNSDYSGYPDFALTLNAVIGLNTNHILTFVIGVGDVNDTVHSSPNFLNRLALAGGEPQSTKPYYYPATSAASLNNVLMQIGNSVLGCKIRADRDPGTDSMLSTEHLWLVYNNGTNDVAIPQDTTNGFEYIGNYVFEVYGTYCDKMKSGTITNIRVIIACHPPY